LRNIRTIYIPSWEAGAAEMQGPNAVQPGPRSGNVVSGMVRGNNFVPHKISQRIYIL